MEKNKIIPFMRKQGKGYGEIANELNITKDNVKKFCKKYGIGGFPLEYKLNVEEAKRRGLACKFCGMLLKQPKVGRKRMYCSNACKQRVKNSKKHEAKTSHHKKMSVVKNFYTLSHHHKVSK